MLLLLPVCPRDSKNLSLSISLRVNVLCHKRGIEGKRLFRKFPLSTFSCMKEAILITLGREKIFPTHTVKPRKLLLILYKLICKLFVSFSPANTLRALPARTGFSTRTLKYSELLDSPKAVACAGSPVGRAWAGASTALRAVNVHRVSLQSESAKILLKPGSGFWLY